MNGSLELRFPILRKKAFWGTLFVDWGALMDSPRDLHKNAFRFSIGTGVRWLIGDQIPMRLDYGIVIDKRCTEVAADTGECLTNDAAGALDFGLLYTF